jgi:hypothetical protein
MILLVHALIGAVIGSYITNYWLIFLLALISHFLMDIIPHRDYNTEPLEESMGITAWPTMIKIALDLGAGIVLILIFVWNSSIKSAIFLGMISAIIPDGLTFLYWRTKNSLLGKIALLHRNILHAKDNKKTPLFWGITIQIVISLIAVLLLL